MCSQDYHERGVIKYVREIFLATTPIKLIMNAGKNGLHIYATLCYLPRFRSA